MSLFAAWLARNSTFDTLRLGIHLQFTVGCILHFWDSHDINQNDAFMGITLLLLDEKNALIHGFVPARRANQYRAFIKTGAIVRLDHFQVARSTYMYKITNHPFVIHFIPGTTIEELETIPTVVNLHRFMVRKLDHLLALANTDLEYPDVVGQIRSFHGSELSDPANRSRITIRLLIDRGEMALLNLAGNALSMFRSILNSQGNSKSKILVTTTKPQVSRAATNYHLDTNITPIGDFVRSLGVAADYHFTCIQTNNPIQNANPGDDTESGPIQSSSSD